MGKVLVKAIEPNYNTLSGGPQFVIGGSGGDRGRGITMRERAGGTLGGLVGVLGALTQPHRSIGGLAQGMVSGGAQGKALGRALGRKFVGRRGQARADIREGRRQEDARLAAQHIDEFGGTRSSEARHVGGGIPFFNRATNREIADRRRQYLQTQAEKERLVAVADAEEQARRKAQAAAEGTQFGEQNRTYAQQYRDLREALIATGIPEAEIEERMNAFTQMARRQGGETVRADPTRGGTVAVQADGSPIGPSMVAVQSTMGLPSPPEGAVAENQKDDAAGNSEALKVGTDHSGEYGGRLLPAPRDEKEEEEPTMDGTSLEQIQEAQARASGKVGVTSLAEIQEQQAREQRGSY